MANPNGRPKKPPAEVLAERMELRLTTAEREAYEGAAQNAGQTLSAWIRGLLNKAAKRKSKRA
jgi:uncharacterized protein (DUF1778 family)